jgi:hypothetical protein
MSSFSKPSKHPVTGKWERALWIDDLFGKHRYGVCFPSDRDKQRDPYNAPFKEYAFDPDEVEIKTKEKL